MNKIALVAFTLLLFACNAKHISPGQIKPTRSTRVFTDADTFYNDWSKQNQVVVQYNNLTVAVHPLNYTTSNARNILLLTHNMLLSYDIIHNALRPDLVKTLPEISTDQLRFTYVLRDEAQWDDGSPITNSDVVFTFKAAKCPLTNDPAAKTYFDNVQNVETDINNEKRFTIVMKQPYVANEYFLTDYPIISKKFFDPNNALDKYSFQQFGDTAFHADTHDDLVAWANEFNNGKYGNDPAYFNGSGAYKITLFEQGSQIVMEKKPNHWMNKLHEQDPYQTSFPDKIIFKQIGDDNAIKLEAKAQTIDVSCLLSTKSLTELQQDINFNRCFHSGYTDNYTMNYIGMNCKPDGVKHKKIFDDVHVRRAMAYLTPVDEIMQVISLGKGTRWPSMVSPLKPEFNADLKLILYNADSAKNLLDAAGWVDTDADGIRDKVVDGKKIKLQFEITIPANPPILKDLATMVSEGMLNAGVKADIKVIDGGQLPTIALTHDFDMIIIAWATPSVPEDFSQLWSTTNWANGGSNFVGFGNAESDALIDSIKYTVIDSLRIPMVKRLQKMVYDQQPYIFMYTPYRKVIIHKRFGNPSMSADLPNVLLNNLRLLSNESNITFADPAVQ